MKYYQIYRHTQNPLTACKLGWSWPGFFLILVWAFSHRVFFAAGVTVVTAAIALVVQQYGMLIWWLISAVFFGLDANNLKRRRLMKRGYTHVATIGAGSPGEAIGKYQKSLTIPED